jgi:FkbM family methyltransferase
MTDTRKGFIVTYFKTSDQGESMLKDLIDTISTENYYLVLAAHSPVPVEIYSKCDYYIYQELNVVDDRKYSHGVAESNLIDLALLHLAYKEIEWTYKVCYDVQINDVNHFKEWIKEGYNFVTCNWGEYYICTNSFYGNVDWLLSNIRFYKNIEGMFSDNTVLEACWQMSIERNGIKDEVYSWPNKTEFFGPNKIDMLFYDYNKIEFWYSVEENRFYIKNDGEDLNCNIRIFDYYTDLCVYLNENWSQSRGTTFWIIPPMAHFMPDARNGHYLEIYKDGQVIRKNINVKDFEHKDPLHKKFKLFKDREVKYNEYSEFKDLGIYKDYGIDISEISNFLDVGACYGFASVPFIERNIKTYLVDADSENVKLLERSYGNNSRIKIIGKAICDIDGAVDFFISKTASVVSSLTLDDANGLTDDRIKITVPAITPNTLIEKYINEEYVDLVKVDIEGAEYDFFKNISDNNIKRIKKFIIEFHKNDNREVLSILEKLAKNDFSYKLYNWGHFTDPYIIDNKMGIIYAYR